MKHYPTCTNPRELVRLHLGLISWVLQCSCCGAYSLMEDELRKDPALFTPTGRLRRAHDPEPHDLPRGKIKTTGRPLPPGMSPGIVGFMVGPRRH